MENILEHGATQSETNDCKFQEVYNYYRKQWYLCKKTNKWIHGHAHIVARRKAIDYYRKYLKREVTENWITQADAAVQDNHIEEEVVERMQFNDIVRIVLTELTDRQLEFFCYVIVQQDLDRYLDDELFKIVITNTCNNHPESVKEIAGCMKLKVSGIGVCTTLTKSRQRIKAIFEKYGIVPKLMGFS